MVNSEHAETSMKFFKKNNVVPDFLRVFLSNSKATAFIQMCNA